MSAVAGVGPADGALLAPVLVTGPTAAPPLRGAALLAGLRVVGDGALVWRDGAVVHAGPREALPPAALAGARRVEGAVLPGFVDCHTHLPFVGWRADEYEARLAGRSYRELQGEGGIRRTARMLAAASDEEVVAFCAAFLAEMLAHGTTALELKTGYGLTVEAELRQARLARRLASSTPQAATVTLLACHAVPDGVSRDEWVRTACEELIPAAAEEGLVDAVDVFVDDGAFTVGDLARLAGAARSHGLAVRCHADQLGASGAAEAAAREGARNADHLNHVTDRGVAALASGRTAAVLLPCADLMSGDPNPPADALVRAGAAVVVATDFNPGTSPCLSMPEVVALACALYRLPPAVALAAATINAAWVLGLDARLGYLEPGKRADFVVLDTADPSAIPYRPGHNPVDETWIGGRRVYARSPN